MPKALCIVSLVVSILIVLLFALDLIVGIPMQGANKTLDIVFLVAGIIVIAMSVVTHREQR